MYLGIEPIPLRGGGGGMCKIRSALVFTSLGALIFTSLGESVRWPSIPASFQSKVKLLSLSIIIPSSSTPDPLFPLFSSPLSPSLPAALKHTLITVSYLWWCFNNSWPQVSRACAGVARVIHHDLANLPLKCRGHLRLCRGKCGQRQQP